MAAAPFPEKEQPVADTEQPLAASPPPFAYSSRAWACPRARVCVCKDGTGRLDYKKKKRSGIREKPASMVPRDMAHNGAGAGAATKSDTGE